MDLLGYLAQISADLKHSNNALSKVQEQNVRVRRCISALGRWMGTMRAVRAFIPLQISAKQTQEQEYERTINGKYTLTTAVSNQRKLQSPLQNPPKNQRRPKNQGKPHNVQAGAGRTAPLGLRNALSVHARFAYVAHHNNKAIKKNPTNN
jgi:hypothetical protein